MQYILDKWKVLVRAQECTIKGRGKSCISGAPFTIKLCRPDENGTAANLIGSCLVKQPIDSSIKESIKSCTDSVTDHWPEGNAPRMAAADAQGLMCIGVVVHVWPVFMENTSAGENHT